ncbi:MAG TPA: ABC transporter permease [Syntrophobacteria bacterium]|nr:ABC transporter permease [Syntrophobacteria bacterium]
MPPISQRALLIKTLKGNKISLVGGVMVILLVTVALIAPWVSPYNPVEQDIGVQLAPPSWAHPFGADSYGRDQLSRILWGSRVSLVVGILSVLFAMAAGIPIGMIGGFKGGRIDSLVLRFIDIFMSFPIVILGLLVLAIMGPGLLKIVIAIGVALTPRIARLARGSTLAIKGKEFIEAARAVGQNDGKIMLIHVLPNIFGDILVMGTLWVATAIIVEASLSFIGLGVRPPTPSWGAMIRDGLDQLTNAPWLSIFAGLAIFVSVFAFNLIADGLRDISDPKLRG